MDALTEWVKAATAPSARPAPRALDPEGFGAFAAAAALIAVVGPFASWGAGDILVQRINREQRSFREEWGAALLKAGVFGLAAIAATLAHL